MKWPIIMHVNYCEQGQSILDICRKAVAWGFDGVEFRRKRYHVEEGVEVYLDALASAIERSRLKHVLIGGPGPDLMQPDAGRRAQELDTFRDFFHRAVKRFKITLCNTMTGVLRHPDKNVPYTWGHYGRHGSAVATEDQWRWAVEGFQALGDMAQEMGFRFAFEVHMGYLHDRSESSRKLVDRIGRASVGVNLDYPNEWLLPSKITLREAIAQLGDTLYYVHLKNYVRLDSGEGIATALGDGEVNHREYLRLLAQNGFEGPICIEAPRAGDREWYAQQDLAYIKSLLADGVQP